MTDNAIDYFKVRSKGGELRGIIHNGNNHIPVIIVHGFFSSNKIGPYRLYYQLADELYKHGYKVLRIDLSAMGESDGEIKQITFDTHVNDLNMAIKKLVAMSISKEIHIIAHCVGCCTALKCIYSMMDNIKSITLLTPFMANERNYRVLLGDIFDRIDNESIYYKGMYCDKSFIDAGVLINDSNMLSSSKNKFLQAYFAEKDQLTPLSDGEKWAKQYQIEYDVIPDADHNFIPLDTRKYLFDLICNRLKELDGLREGI